MNFDKWKIYEAAYPGNMGIEEMIKFYKIASKSEIKKMERAVDKKDWQAFKDIVKEVLGVDLV